MDNSPTVTGGGAGAQGDTGGATAGTATTDQVLARLRLDGGRVTEARRAVVEELLEAGGEHVHLHLTAEELAARVKARHPEVHRSTVYRTLERLQETGVVAHTHLGHGPSTFHLTDHPHHHAVCRSCSAVVELEPGALDDLATRLRQQGWALAPQHFALSALCPDCATVAG